MEYLKALTVVRQKYSTSVLKELSLDLVSDQAVHTVAFISRIFPIKKLNITSSNSTSLNLLLKIPNLNFKHLKLALPDKGIKPNGEKPSN